MYPYTAEILLRIAHGHPSDALDALLAEEAQRIRSRLGTTEARVSVYHSLAHHRGWAPDVLGPPGSLDDLIVAGLPPASVGVPVTSFDAVLEVTIPAGADPAPLPATVGGLAGRLSPFVDLSGSAAVLGVDHPIIDGEGAVRLFYCLRRVPGLSHEEFCTFWRNRLVEHTTKTPAKTAYRQLHADLRLTAELASRVGVGIDDVDGMALEWYPSVDGLLQAVRWAAEPHAAIIEAESRMSDFGRAMAVLTGAGVG